jgi:hypothetical protein
VGFLGGASGHKSCWTVTWAAACCSGLFVFRPCNRACSRGPTSSSAAPAPQFQTLLLSYCLLLSAIHVPVLPFCLTTVNVPAAVGLVAGCGARSKCHIQFWFDSSPALSPWSLSILSCILVDSAKVNFALFNTLPVGYVVPSNTNATGVLYRTLA